MKEIFGFGFLEGLLLTGRNRRGCLRGSRFWSGRILGSLLRPGRSFRSGITLY